MGTRRYIVCLNPAQAREDAADREAIVEALEQVLKQGATSLVGNKGLSQVSEGSKRQCYDRS